MLYENILGAFLGLMFASIVGYFFFYRPEKKYKQKLKKFKQDFAEKTWTERKERDWLNDPDWWKR